MKRIIALAALALLFSGCQKKKESTEAVAAKATKATSPSAPQTILDLPDPMATATQHATESGSEAGANNVYRLLRRNLAMVNACYKRQRRRDPELSGKLTVKIRVGPGPKGLVEQASVIARTFRNDSMERCVIGSLRAFSFPRKDDEPLDMTVPLLFR